MVKYKSKIGWLFSFISTFNLGFGVIFSLSSCSKKNSLSNNLSYILDPKTCKKYFFDNLTKTNICGLDGNIVVCDQKWERKKFNLPIFLSDKIKKIGDNFLGNCTEFDQQINIPNSCLEIGDNFLFNCHKFNSNLHFTNAIKNIGNNFMYKCSSFNKELHLDYLVDLSQIGDNFLYECVEFNHEINIKSKHLKIIGDSFLHGCKKFNSNFYLNSPVLKGIGDSFFECCTSYNKPIDFSNLIGLKSLKKKYFAHCENFNSDMILPPNLMEIDDDFMINNCEYNHPLIFPNSIKTIGKSCCANLIKYNQNINIPESIIARDSINDTSDKYGIGDYFFRNCWSMTSIINFGLHDIAKIFIGSNSLSCDVLESEQEKSSQFNEFLCNNRIALYFLKEFIVDKKAVDIIKSFLKYFSFCEIGVESEVDKKIEIIYETLSFFEQYLVNADSIKKYFDNKNIDKFKKLLEFSKKLEVILVYLHEYAFEETFLEYYNNNSESFKLLFDKYKEKYSLNSRNDYKNDEIKPKDVLEKILSHNLLDEIKKFCDRHNYFYEGIKLKSLSKISRHDLLSNEEKSNSWKYSNTDLYRIKSDVCKNEAINFTRVFSTFTECRGIKFLLDFISSKFIDDKILTNDKLKQFFISKVKSLNQSEIKLLLTELNNPNQNSIFNKEFGVKIDEQRGKIKNNLNKILESEPNLKEVFAPFLNEKNDDTNVIDFNWSELIDFLDIVNEYGLKYDNSSDNLDINNVLRKSLKKIGEHFDENERLLILDWLNKKESDVSNQLKKYQLLIRIALSNLIDKNRLIDQMFDELFDFDLENSNVIKKIKGEEVDLHEFDNIVLNRIQDEIIFKKIYDWSRDTFKTSDHDERIAMFTYVDFFVEKLWNAEFFPNWFNDVINKNDSLQQIFTPSKIKNVFTTFWNNELQKRQLKQRKIKEKYDKYHKQFTQGLCDFLIKNLNRSNLIPIAKKVLREKLQKDLINEINKISVEIMRDKFFNKNANNDFINDLKKNFVDNKQIFADCSFLEKSHVDFIGKLQDEVYVQSLLSRIFSFEFRNKKNAILLYFYLFNKNYHNYIIEKLRDFGGQISSIFYRRILNLKQDFYEKLCGFSFYNDIYEQSEKKFFLKQIYNDFLKQLFKDTKEPKNQWFRVLFWLGEPKHEEGSELGDKILVDFLNKLPKEKKEKWDNEVKKNQYLYNDFKYQIIWFFKTALANIINDKKNNLSYFKILANDITTENSYAVKMLNEIIKLYDQKILTIKNDDNFQKSIFDKFIEKNSLFDWLEKNTINQDKWDCSIPSEYEIIKQIKNYKYQELNCFTKHIDNCKKELEFLTPDYHQNFSLALNQEIFNQLIKLQEKWQQNKPELISYYLAQLWDESCINWNDFVKKFDDDGWKNNDKNKPIIDNLTSLLDCSSDEINSEKINSLDEEMKKNIHNLANYQQIDGNKLNGQLSEIMEINRQFKINKEKIIPFYLSQLGDENYINWDNFVNQFNNPKWKETSKNISIIKNLAILLDCRSNQIDAKKINDLNEETKNSTKKLLSEKCEMINESKTLELHKNQLKENEEQLVKNKEKFEQSVKQLNQYKNQLEESKKKLIIFHIIQLWDESCESWDEFVKKFDDDEWKNSKKNKTTIEVLSNLFDCLNSEINVDKINKLDSETKKNIIDLIHSKSEVTSELNEIEEDKEKIEEQIKTNKNRLITLYLSQLGNEKYTNWDSFVKKFDNNGFDQSHVFGFKSKNSIIEALAKVLNCTYEQVNSEKINSLDDVIKKDTQDLLNYQKKKRKELKDFEEKEKQYNKNKKKLIIFYLTELWDKNYIDWKNFVANFDDGEWKYNEKNEQIISALANILDCPISKVNGNKIDGLDKEIKNDVKNVFSAWKKDVEELKEIEKFEGECEKKEIESIPFYLSQLWDEKYTDWDSFVKKFDNNGFDDPGFFGFLKKNPKKTKLLFGTDDPSFVDFFASKNPIIDKLANFLKCGRNQINSEKIDSLDEETKNIAKYLLNQKKLIIDKTKEKEEIEKQLKDCENRLIPFYLDQLGNNYNDWDDFIKKFDDAKWKEKNKKIISKLGNIFECTQDKINSDKINNLDEEIKNEAKKLFSNRKKTANRLNKIKEFEDEYEKNKKKLVPFYLSELWDENYTDWDSFVKKFDNNGFDSSVLLGMVTSKNPIIDKLAKFLNYPREKIDAEIIDSLDEETKKTAKYLLNQKKLIVDKAKEKEQIDEQLESIRTKLINCYLIQLAKNQYKDTGNFNYDLNDFTTKFNDDEWKNSKKNKLIIGKLAHLLNCSFDNVDSDKIVNVLSSSTRNLIKDRIKKYLISEDNIKKIKIPPNKVKTIEKSCSDDKKELIPFYLSQLWDENYTDWDSFVAKFNDNGFASSGFLGIFGSNNPIVDTLAKIFGCKYEQVNSEKINNLDKKTKDIAISLLDYKKGIVDRLKESDEIAKRLKSNKLELIPFYLSQLWDKDCINWDGFVAKFNDEGWKNNEKNKQIIDTLANLFDCAFEQISSDKINTLDEETKKNTENLFNHQKQVDEKMESVIEIEKQLVESNKVKLIPFYLVQLWDESCTSWDDFVKKFDDDEWKNNGKNKPIITILANLLWCPVEQINYEKINSLDDRIKTIINELLVYKKQMLDSLKEKTQIMGQLESNKTKLIAFYLSQLWDESCINWDDFVKKFDDIKWKEKNKSIIDTLTTILSDDNQIDSEKVNNLDKKIKIDTKNLVKNQQNLFKHSTEENYISIEEIAKYCKEVNDFFTFVDDTLFQCGREDLQFSDLEAKKEIIDSLKKMHNCLKKPIELYEKKTVFMLYEDVAKDLKNYDKMRNSISLLNIVEKVSKLNKIFLQNKEVINSNADNAMINFSATINDILTKLIKQNNQYNNNFLNNYFFNNFYLIYELSALHMRKSNISIKQMSKIDLISLQSKINNSPENTTPIDQLKNLSEAVKQDIYNYKLHESEE